MESDAVDGRRVAPVPHDEVRKYFDGLGSTSVTWRSGDVAALRAETRTEAMAVRGPLEPIAGVEDIAVGATPCRLYRPITSDSDSHAATGGVAVWVHGGGWVHGDLDSYEGVTRALAAASGVPVLAMAYRLAPERPFPAALDDVWAVVEWATNHFSHVALAGDSSGGNLVAATAIRARDAGVPLALQVLIYPVLDSSDATPYKLRFRDRYTTFAGQPDFGPTAFDRINSIWAHYIPEPALRVQPYASPMRASSLRGVAPAVVITAEHDILRGEAEDFVERLRADGVPVTLHEFAGQIHGFFQMRAVLSDAHRAMELVGDAIRTALEQPAGAAARPSGGQTRQSEE